MDGLTNIVCDKAIRIDNTSCHNHCRGPEIDRFRSALKFPTCHRLISNEDSKEMKRQCSGIEITEFTSCPKLQMGKEHKQLR